MIILFATSNSRYLVNAPANALDAQVRLRFAMGNGMRSEYWGPFEERYHVQEESFVVD